MTEHRLFHHGVVDSTNERCFAALDAGEARHGDVHVAEGQAAGRGRRGRAWASPAGEGLYASVVLLFEPPAPAPAALTMAAGLAARDGLEALGVGGVTLKWPNDVLVGGAKLCGILVESRGLDPARPAFVCGIGMNVRQTSFPAELEAERAVTSLALLGIGAGPGEVLAALLPPFDRRLRQASTEPAELARDFAAATGCLERDAVVRCGDATLRGRVVALSLEEGLVLSTPAGEVERRPLEHVTALELDAR